MTNLEQIDNAINSHENWKNRLSNAIAYGKSDLEYDKVKADHYCEFGKWLYVTISKELKKSDMYDKVVNLHAEFHKEAAQILYLAVNGKKTEAKKLMDLGSNYTVISTRLVVALTDWKKALKL